MLPLKVRIGSSSGVGDGGSSVLRNNWNGMAGKVLSLFMAVGFKGVQLYICSMLFSVFIFLTIKGLRKKTFPLGLSGKPP